MAAYHGKGGVVYVGVGANAPSQVVRLSDWSIDMQTDMVEVTSLGDTQKNYVQGLMNLKGTFTGYYDDTEDKLFQTAESSTGGSMYIYPSALNTLRYFYGPAWLSVTITGSVKDAVKISCSFVANGAWKRHAATP